jgi:hypothetical protein
MRAILIAILMAAVIVSVGCVSTVNDRTTGGNPFTKDKVEGRYERTVEQVFDAAKDVVKFNGTLVNESTMYTQTNAVRTIQGKVNQANVWMRIEPVDPKVTAIIVQARTSGGGSDIGLAHELEKQVALKLNR